uniref:Uncharacterized protein n=1 Tax=Panagrolaimus sp. ES5 TaxID=591445 RepID=A0AC34G0D8_9BILA
MNSHNLLKDELLNDGKELSNSTISPTQKPEESGGSITTLTIIICCVTIIWWFATLIVAFILCMKYMGTQKKRAPPPPREDLSNIEYEEFSDVPDEANYLEKNSKIQGIKNKMGRAVKKGGGGGGKKQEGSVQDEFAI